jgi:hypothetical protein
MSRIFGSSFAVASLASVSLCLILAGCGSSSGDTPDAGPTTCDFTAANAIFVPKCATAGCHDATGSAAGLDMKSAGLETRLLGKMPPGGGTTFPSVCSGMNKIYLVAGSNPASGLFIDKLTSSPGCGAQMPYTGAKLSTAETNCIKSWATSVTAP